MTVAKISGINMVISTVRNVEPNGENIISIVRTDSI